MRIIQVQTGKEKYLPLLLLGDEQESLILGYLERGDLFVLEQDGEALGVCVVTREAPGEYELQNIAIVPAWQRKGLGGALVEYVWGPLPGITHASPGNRRQSINSRFL